MIRKNLLILTIIFIANSVFSQEKQVFEDENTLIDQAQSWYSKSDYLKALPLFKKLVALNPSSSEYSYKLGICYLYKGNEKGKSI